MNRKIESKGVLAKWGTAGMVAASRVNPEPKEGTYRERQRGGMLQALSAPHNDMERQTDPTSRGRQWAGIRGNAGMPTKGSRPACKPIPPAGETGMTHPTRHRNTLGAGQSTLNVDLPPSGYNGFVVGADFRSNGRAFLDKVKADFRNMRAFPVPTAALVGCRAVLALVIRSSLNMFPNVGSTPPSLLLS
ncbi:hypothetical protein VOLCADRAFT_87387 [Volvox carteri f. nagariensis]|uniref:Uncharacterized protein n=1 Tax=Volvox carteri f. nagariensis TaxID=3068 RepID=D8TL79_VOLCA|nr:uncharacterized protein VOLCADRAFT_87387 [Volvox carteri f. nagariensis]EFJ51824.1 hypothetical protein VOLCADRAFT_87387 [Volvox carteri f. nagariensis]|eukprot:XP_002947234.1 hypothetical protein VOLCADRAFT_87387 [Volvox carteri f. nagariensis]